MKRVNIGQWQDKAFGCYLSPVILRQLLYHARYTQDYVYSTHERILTRLPAPAPSLMILMQEGQALNTHLLKSTPQIKMSSATYAAHIFKTKFVGLQISIEHPW